MLEGALGLPDCERLLRLFGRVAAGEGGAEGLECATDPAGIVLEVRREGPLGLEFRTTEMFSCPDG